MKKIRIGIFGYGNLGKAIESIVVNDKRFELVVILSRRAVKSKFGANTDFASNLKCYEGKIDVMFLCGGSSSDLMPQAQECLKYFNCIDAFDTHAKIDEHIAICNDIALQNSKVAFCCIGWDPGLFSLMRVVFTALGYSTYTAWGKGVSQGHTEAIRCVKGVIDAVQYTVPNKAIIKKLKNNKLKELKNIKDLHIRECFICARPENYEAIKNQVVCMPNYFDGYVTKVKFLNQEQMTKHKKMYHAGEVFCVGDEVNFKIKTLSNPNFTANILVAYSVALTKYYNNNKFGAYSILDIPVGCLLDNSKKYI